MLHIYAIVLAVALLVGALAAIIVCVCVDIVPIIKSRGSTLMSRDSITQEQTRMLKKSLQRTKLTSSASADFIDSGRKGRGQAIRKDRPRYGSTPLTLLSGEDEKSEDLKYKTTTVIIEALPKKSTSENKIDDVESNEKVEIQNLNTTDNGNEISTRYETRSELTRLKRKSGSSPNVATKRSNSMDFLDQNIESSNEIQTYNPRDPVAYEIRAQSTGYPSPAVASNRKLQPITLESRGHSSRDATRDHIRGNLADDALHSSYQHHPTSPLGSHGSGADFNENSDDNSASPTSSGSQHCHWCVMERGKHVAFHERHLTFPRNENYEENSSPRPYPHQMHRQRSLEDSESGIFPKGFPYDRNKYCKNAHRGYSPCPDCFHTNSSTYFMHGYQTDVTSPNDLGCQGLSMKNPIQGAVPHLISTSSSSSSSGSSSRFRHIRQPLEDIQEDASDCYAMRDIAATSTIDSRDLDSGPDDGTMPKSTDNSVTSASPIIVAQTHTPVIPNSVK